MILNRNPFEWIGGIVAMAAAIRFGWWMFRQLGKPGYTEMEDSE